MHTTRKIQHLIKERIESLISIKEKTLRGLENPKLARNPTCSALVRAGLVGKEQVGFLSFGDLLVLLCGRQKNEEKNIMLKYRCDNNCRLLYQIL